jgi:hypothetical protein
VSWSPPGDTEEVPFTPSHIAAALPFLRTPLLPSAVVIGTMAPDVPYYLPVRFPRDLTHSLAGAPTVDLLIAVTLVLLWYAVLRAPIVDLAPAAIRTRMPQLGPLAWRQPGRSWPFAVVLMLLGALVGILTHLAWDSFTHEGWLVDAVPVFQQRLGPLPLVAWLQHTSTIVGLVILAVWAARWLSTTTPDAARPTTATAGGRVAAWIAVVVAFAGTGLAVWIGFIAFGLPPFDPSPVFLATTAAGGASGLTGFIICAIWWIARASRAAARV